ncbi:MAG TPA: trypsin-like serine protease [Polyangiaceae bacterium]|nr:trypsin-like serine protease [Polyangiaceae bacterium]
MTHGKLARHSLVVFLWAVACSSPTGNGSDPGLDPLANEQTFRVTYGSADDGHAGVVSILAETAEGGSWLLCTGVLVGPRAVLTAAHCLNDASATPLRVAFGANSQQPTMTRSVIARHVHPEYEPEPLSDHDLAVLAIERDVPSSIAPFTYDLPVTESLVRLVGFGANESGSLIGRKRTGTARIDEVGTTRFRVAPAPSLTCFHDSGAPAFFEQGETEMLVGITTSGRNDCAGFSRFMRTDVYWDSFIRPSISLADSLPVAPAEPIAGRPVGGCQMQRSGVPASSRTSAALLGVVLVQLRRLRRSRR